MISKFFSDFTLKNVLVLIFGWRVLLFILAFIMTNFFVKDVYTFPYVDTILEATGLPKSIWGFANFDGVHYLRTSLWGYVSEYSQAFFPLFSILMWLLSSWNTIFEQKAVLLLSGLLISFVSSIGTFYYLHKVFQITVAQKYINYSLMLLLFFPTSFYLLSVYTESLFLFLTALSVFLVLKKKYLYASIFIALATATKVVGVFLILFYFIEVVIDLYKNKKLETKSDLFIKLFGLVVCCSGILMYMFFLFLNYNNPFYFINAQPVFGTGRQVESFVILPQVFYRYLKIILTVPYNSYQFFSVINELVFSTLGLLLLILSFRKVRFSIWVFSLGAYILPTLTGTFTSMPRYVLMMFLLFPVIAEYTMRYKTYILSIFVVLQIIFCSLFVIGFWIA